VQLRVHLDYLYLQVLSVVTHAQLEAIFARRSNFDLRRMLEGTLTCPFPNLSASHRVRIPYSRLCSRSRGPHRA